MANTNHKSILAVKVTGRNLDDLLPLLKKFPVEILGEDDGRKPDLVISHGGDGSLLGAERQFPGIPKCPIRDDAQNPKCPKHGVSKILKDLFAGELTKSKLDTLVAKGPDGRRISGVNDIVISRKLFSAAIRYRIVCDGKVIRPQVIADGLVMSTPFGSTGYFQSITGGNLSAGIGLAYNNAVDGQRFDVIPLPKNLNIEILRGPAIVCADNNPDFLELETGDVLEVSSTRRRTSIYGIDVFRCHDCYQLRRNGKA